jgi:hypothetical protein
MLIGFQPPQSNQASTVMEGSAMFGEHLGGIGHVTASNKEMAYLSHLTSKDYAL